MLQGGQDQGVIRVDHFSVICYSHWLKFLFQGRATEQNAMRGRMGIYLFSLHL